jgi:hypothetical protein
MSFIVSQSIHDLKNSSALGIVHSGILAGDKVHQTDKRAANVPSVRELVVEITGRSVAPSGRPICPFEDAGSRPCQQLFKTVVLDARWLTVFLGQGTKKHASDRKLLLGNSLNRDTANISVALVVWVKEITLDEPCTAGLALFIEPEHDEHFAGGFGWLGCLLGHDSLQKRRRDPRRVPCSAGCKISTQCERYRRGY